MISLKNVSYTYPNGKKAINNVSLRVEGRTFVGGKTASGKTTLLRIISGLIPGFYGGRLEGFVERNKTYFVPQGEQIVSTTVAYEIALPLLHSGVSWEEAFERVKSVARRCGIEGLLWEKTWKLSDGQKKIVAIASALASDSIPVMDEPFANLHPDVAEKVLSLLDVCVVSEHRLEFMDRFDDIVWLENGRLSEVPDFGEMNCEFEGEVGEVMLVVDSVTFGFDRKLFENVSFEVRRGEVVALVGRNGCGKTTLLRLIAGFLKPWSGKIAIRGDVGIAFAFPNYHLFEKRVEKEVGPEMLRLFGLEDLKGRHPHTLSFGEAKRVAIAKAFERDVVLLDEPTAGQDWNFACKLIRLAKRLRKAVLVATHDLEFARMCDDIVGL